MSRDSQTGGEMMRTFDQIIDANMTVTDHLLRGAIHAVIVDAIYEAVEQEREECAKLCETEFCGDDVAYYVATAIRARGEK